MRAMGVHLWAFVAIAAVVIGGGSLSGGAVQFAIV